MRRLVFWWRRRRIGLPVPFGSRPSNVSTYSQRALLKECDCQKRYLP